MPSKMPIGIDNADADAVDRGYEFRDINVRALLMILGGFAVLFAVLLGGLWWFLRHERGKPAAWSSPRSVVSRPAIPADAPPLQPQEGHDSLDAWDLAKMRANEDFTFDALGWTRDAKTHRYVVPAAVLSELQRKAATRPQGLGG